MSNISNGLAFAVLFTGTLSVDVYAFPEDVVFTTSESSPMRSKRPVDGAVWPVKDGFRTAYPLAAALPGGASRGGGAAAAAAAISSAVLTRICFWDASGDEDDPAATGSASSFSACSALASWAAFHFLSNVTANACFVSFSSIINLFGQKIGKCKN